MGTGNSKIYKGTKWVLKLDHLMEELRESGVKFTEKDVVMITKTKNGELVWLEVGNNLVGLKHIIDRYEKDFYNKFEISKERIPIVIKDIFDNGIEVNSKLKNEGYEKEYLYKNEYNIIIGLGKNGFIISIYHKSKGFNKNGKEKS